MRLTISSSFVRNAIFANEEGQVLYKTTHPAKIGGTTTVHKVVPNANSTDMHDNFAVIGEIEWHMIGSSVFRLHDRVMNSNDFIPSHGIAGRKRTFIGPDDRPYKWDLDLSVVVLSRDDAPMAEVARYHRSTLGIVGPKDKGHLDIDPSVTHMLDLIVLTFVYVEKLRMDIEKGVLWKIPPL